MLNRNINPDDTICAISTPTGIGGIAVARVSGPDTFQIIDRCWKGINLSETHSHTAHLGHIIDHETNQPLDQVVLTIYRGPHSFTGQDVAEIACHGSTFIQQRLLEVLIHAGARLATAGEFTRRAVMAGRLDLAQAEAVADLINAHSQRAAQLALSQLRGQLSQRLNNLHDQLIHFAALLELELDFSEEDVEFADRGQLLELARNIDTEISRLIQSFQAGNAIRNGLPIAIVGAPNAGKSTLLNALLADQRALVSNIAGTTRDTIEDTLTINGILLRLIDTAGLHHTTDTIESLGIQRTQETIQRAQIIIWVVDGTAPAQSTQQARQHILTPDLSEKKLLILCNKSDHPDFHPEIINALRSELPQDTEILHISAHNNNHILQVTQTIATLAEQLTTTADVAVANARHHEALVAARQSLERVIEALQTGISADLVALDLRQVTYHLGQITGQITTETILSEIFAKFCIGK